MRFLGFFVSIFALAATASAADLKIKVLDPQSAVVSGAQVELTRPDSSVPLAVGITSAEGLAVFRDVAGGSYRAQILAPGFAAQTIDVSPSAEAVDVKLRLVPAAETVVVTATRNPVPTELVGTDVSTLSRGALEVMHPVASNDTAEGRAKNRRVEIALDPITK